MIQRISSNGVVFRTAALALTVVIGLSTTCVASLQLTFDNAAVDGGTVSYDGVGGSLVGTGILFDRVKGVDTPANNGTILNIVGGVLSFATGPNTGEGPFNWSFAGGGSFTLIGSAYNGAAIPANLIATGTLLSGSFTNALAVSAGGVGSALVVTSFGIDQKNVDLLAFYGVTDPNFTFANTEISGVITALANGGFTATVSEADIVNSAVPEATTLLIWGGLAGMALLRSRQRVAC